jgi:hypothetical protein
MAINFCTVLTQHGKLGYCISFFNRTHREKNKNTEKVPHSPLILKEKCSVGKGGTDYFELFNQFETDFTVL